MAQPRRAKAGAKAADDLKGARVLVVEARFYDDIGEALLAGATKVLDASGKRYDAIVALGCVIRGDTIHFEIVSQESARALMDLSVAKQIPLGNGILTVNEESQAWARARVEEGDKGGDAARAALSMLRHRRALTKAGKARRSNVKRR
jgi:6,7-dimethyl-8-ribityllumazine synthase